MAKTCNGCNSLKEMVDMKDIHPVSFAAHEAEVSRQERQIKRMWIAIIVLAVMWFFTNMIWIGVFSSYDYSSEEITYSQDGHGTNIIGDSNKVNESETNNTQEESD